VAFNRAQPRATGLGRVLSYLNRLELDLRHMEPRLEDSRDAYFKHVRGVFSSEGSRGSGKAWPNLSARRVAQRSGSDHPILQWDGHLARAASQPGGFSGTKIRGWQDIRSNRADFNLEGWKIGPHPGSQGGSGKQGGREFWPWDAMEHDKIEKVFDRWSGNWLAGRWP
jgi:hypothetical protein